MSSAPQTSMSLGKWIVLGCLGVFALFVAAAFLFPSKKEPVAAPPLGATGTTIPLPPYKVTEDRSGFKGQITITVDTADPAVLRALFDKMRAEHTDGDSWYVAINCVNGGSSSYEPRTANGQFANTQRGLAQTGLASTSDVEFRPTDLKTCPGPLPPSPPGGVTAEQVQTAVAATGLPVPNVRDNSGNCQPGTTLNCTRHITNDIFTVREWPTPDDAQRFAQAWNIEETVVIGNATVSFHRGGSTPHYDLAAYKAALPKA